MKNLLLSIGVAVIGAYILYVSISVGLTSSEIAECQRWKEHATQIEKFWLTPAERKQCEAVGVDVSEIKNQDE